MLSYINLASRTGEDHDDVYHYIKAVEDDFVTWVGYMQRQGEISPDMRKILIQWLVDVHLQFGLIPETLFLAVQIIDRYLSVAQVSRRNLQLVGITSMLIASKYEEIRGTAPEIHDIVHICAGTYTAKEILKMEWTILSKIKMKITSPTSYHFLVYFIEACVSKNVRGFEMLCMYAIEIALPEYDTIGIRFSQISAASILLALEVLVTGQWTNSLENHTGYKQSEIQTLTDNIRGLMVKAANSAGTNEVYQKYAQPKFASVALLVTS